MKIGKTIVENNLIVNDGVKINQRETVRAIVFNEQKQVLMIHSKVFDDYTFPGGGLKDGETLHEGLVRELSEEVGASDVEIIENVGYIEELKYSLGASKSVYRQKSHYFICKIGSYGETNLVGREKEQGLKAIFVNVDEVIKHNEIVNKKRTESPGMQTVLIRENRILNIIKGLIKWENLKL